jgi:hypothetical protein
MASWRWWSMIPVGCPSVKHMFIGKKLDITNFENHVQTVLQTKLLKHVCRFNLLGRQRRDDTLT